MKNKTALLTLLFLGLFFLGCQTTFVSVLLNGDKNIIEQSLPAAPFHRIYCAFPLTVHYSQSMDTTAKPSALLRTDSNILNYLDVRVENGTLNISAKTGNTYRNHTLKPTVCELFVSSSFLTGLSVSGSGVVNIVTPFNSRYLHASIAGSGKINFLYDVTADKFSAMIEGSGKMSTYKLQAAQIEIAVQGSGEIFMDEAYADQFKATLNGSGNIESNNLSSHQISNVLNGSGTILNGKVECGEYRASLNGSGTIRGEGSADESHFSIRGSGTVECPALLSRIVRSSIMGSGQVYTTASDIIDSNVLGSGKLFYQGEPRRVNNTVQGSGGVQPLK